MNAKGEQAFSDLEAVKLAVGLEQEGLAFYRAVRAAAGGGESAATFEMLAGEEEKHLATFEDVAGELARAKTEEYWDEPDVDAYIRAVVHEKIFPRPELAPAGAEKMTTPVDALRFALQAEKDTVLYYSLCAEKARDAAVRKTFYGLVAEERRHVALMARLLREAGAGG